MIFQAKFNKKAQRSFVAIIAIILMCLFTYGLLTTSAQSVPTHPFHTKSENGNTTQTIAYRGGLGLWPENTLYAFQQSEVIGSDAIQMDVRMSLDNTLVAMHDSTVERTTNGFGAVNQLTLTELQNLDAGYQWSQDTGFTFKYRGQGITIPTIAEVFAEIDSIQIYVAIKDDELFAANLLCMNIRDYNMNQKVLVSADNDLVLEHFRKPCPEIATSASGKEQKVFTALNAAFLTPIYSPKFHLVELPSTWYGLRLITPNLIQSAHLRGLRVHAVNINESDQMELVIQQGIDGVVTDYPNLMIDVINDK